jgi:hypothetical protein
VGGANFPFLECQRRRRSHAVVSAAAVSYHHTAAVCVGACMRLTTVLQPHAPLYVLMIVLRFR